MVQCFSALIHLVQSSKMSMVGDMALNWKFKRSFQMYVMASGVSEQTDKAKAAFLLCCIEEEVCDTVETFIDAEKKSCTILMTKLEAYFSSRSNVVWKHKNSIHEINCRTKTFDASLVDLKLTALCEFKMFNKRQNCQRHQ